MKEKTTRITSQNHAYFFSSHSQSRKGKDDVFPRDAKGAEDFILSRMQTDRGLD